MDVNYILIKGNKHFKCHSLAEMAIYFSLFWTAHPHVPLSPYLATVKRIGAKKRCSERGKRHKFLIHFSSTS